MKPTIVFLKIFLTFLVKECLSNSDDVLVLTDEEYYQMPDLFALDNYEKCLSQKNAVFCVGTFELLSSKPNPIYDVITKFSENSFSNFNHTKIHRGTCLGARNGCPLKENTTRSQAFESCVNENMRKEYGLQARLVELVSCKLNTEHRQFDAYDWAFLYYVIALIGLNVAGTIYGVWLREGTEGGNRFLLCFSMKANWSRFKGGALSDERYHRLKCFDGLRAILTILVHVAHVPMALMIYTANPRTVEQLSSSPISASLTNGTVTMQAFLVISMFLRAYKTYIDAEKSTPTIMTVVKATFNRFVRIAPLFMTSVGFSATLMAYTNDGPLWSKYIEDETQVCRDTFWRQFFMMQHWFAPSCLPQAWYLSVDFQLYVICSFLTVYLIRSDKNPMRVMLWLLGGSVVALFGIIYALELKPCVQSMTPEALYSLFKTDKSFILLYQSLWGNFPGALMGVIAGYIYYTARQKNIDLKDYKWFVFAFRMFLPITVFYCVGGYLISNNMTSRWTVSLYATLDKPVYAAVIVCFILGCIFEINHFTRRAVEWPGFEVIAKLSLASLLCHVTLMKTITATKIYPQTYSKFNIVTQLFAMTVSTLLLSLPLVIMVEYPFMALYKTFAEPLFVGKNEVGKIKENGQVRVNGPGKSHVN